MAIEKTPKQNVDPGRPISRPMAPLGKEGTWGKTLTKAEWVKLMKKLDDKKKERDMSKLSETLAKALEKKQGKTHVDGSDATVIEKKVKAKPSAGPAKKPPTRSAGRGR